MDKIRIEKWMKDMEYLESELPKRHKNLFYILKAEDFYQQIDDLKEKIRAYDDLEIYIYLSRIIASVRDAHTSVTLPMWAFLPISFYWFPEGIYIVGATPKYKKFINFKVNAINGISINKIIKLFKGIISHENNAFFMSQFPKFLPAAEILYGLEVVDEIDEVEFTLEDLRGDVQKVKFDTVRYSEYNDILLNEAVTFEQLPLYRRYKEKHYWSCFIEKSNALYINYNSCRETSDLSVSEFCETLRQSICNNKVHKLIIDFRNNLGGNSSLFEPFINELQNFKQFNKQNSSIFVIIGRDTFSSALLNVYSIINKTKAVLVGEPTGGKPNCYGEVQKFYLPNSNLEIRYSTEYYKIIKSDKKLSLLPDIRLNLSFGDYIENRDPCLDYILSR